MPIGEVIGPLEGSGGGGSGPSTPTFSALLGDGVHTTWTLAHNFGTTALASEVRETASPFRKVLIDVMTPDVNTAVVQFSNIPSLNSYQVFLVA